MKNRKNFKIVITEICCEDCFTGDFIRAANGVITSWVKKPTFYQTIYFAKH